MNENDIKKLRDGLKAANTCNYFERLLESNNCQPCDYNEFQEALPSKKRFTDAGQRANLLYNVEIRDSILNQITIPSFAEVCKNLPCTQHTPFVQEKLFKTKEHFTHVLLVTLVCKNKYRAPSRCIHDPTFRHSSLVSSSGVI